ncbi:MAG: class I SAM-dependent methyltransferase [Flammeovirgaceae bacterium]
MGETDTQAYHSETKDKIASYLKEINVELPVEEFIHQISNIYHYHEAMVYDTKQIGLFDKNHFFQTALASIEDKLPAKIHALDFGCGTGFGALEMIKKFGSRIELLVCFDLSPDMLQKCREKIERDHKEISVVYLSDLAELPKVKDYSFDLVVTNAVLHHLLNLKAHFDLIDAILKPEGFYLIGHEPNTRFYKNKDLLQHTLNFQKFKRVANRMTLDYILTKLKVKSRRKNVSELTIRDLINKGLIKEPIPSGKVCKLVDIHVPHGIASEQPWGFLGFSPEVIIDKFLPNYSLYTHITHTHIKDDKAMRYARWRKLDKSLAEKYPKDGAVALMILQKGIVA